VTDRFAAIQLNERVSAAGGGFNRWMPLRARRRSVKLRRAGRAETGTELSVPGRPVRLSSLQQIEGANRLAYRVMYVRIDHGCFDASVAE